jgi:hypothetical protein
MSDHRKFSAVTTSEPPLFHKGRGGKGQALRWSGEGSRGRLKGEEEETVRVGGVFPNCSDVSWLW